MGPYNLHKHHLYICTSILLFFIENYRKILMQCTFTGLDRPFLNLHLVVRKIIHFPAKVNKLSNVPFSRWRVLIFHAVIGNIKDTGLLYDIGLKHTYGRCAFLFSY